MVVDVRIKHIPTSYHCHKDETWDYLRCRSRSQGNEVPLDGDGFWWEYISTESGDQCSGNRLFTDGMKFGLHQWTSKPSFSSSQSSKRRAYNDPSLTDHTHWLHNSPFTMIHLIYPHGYTSSGQKFLNTSHSTQSRVLGKSTSSLATNKFIGYPVLQTQLLIYLILVSDIQKKMPYSGLVWPYEPLNSCDDGDNIWQATWPGTIIIQTG